MLAKECTEEESKAKERKTSTAYDSGNSTVAGGSLSFVKNAIDGSKWTITREAVTCMVEEPMP